MRDVFGHSFYFVSFSYHFCKLDLYAKCRVFTVNGVERQNH